MTSGHRDEEISRSADPRPLSATGILWTYVAWLLPTTLLVPAAVKGSAVDVRIAYLVFPVYNLALVVLLTRYWYRLTWNEVGMPLLLHRAALVFLRRVRAGPVGAATRIHALRPNDPPHRPQCEISHVVLAPQAHRRWSGHA